MRVACTFAAAIRVCCHIPITRSFKKEGQKAARTAEVRVAKAHRKVHWLNTIGFKPVYSFAQNRRNDIAVQMSLSKALVDETQAKICLWQYYAGSVVTLFLSEFGSFLQVSLKTFRN